jgi:hypothetical protein
VPTKKKPTKPKSETPAPVGAPATWTTPQQLLNDFELFLAEQKPHPVKEWANVKELKEGREDLKHPRESDYEWNMLEVERISKQGLVTVVQFAAWKKIHRTTITTGFSEGAFKEVYSQILSICEAYSERRLYEAERNAANLIFAMKNAYGWVDKTETELSGAISQPLSEEAKAYLAKATRSNEAVNPDDDGTS